MPTKKEAKKKTIKKINIDEKVEINPILKDEEPDTMIVEKEKFKIPFINNYHEFKTTEVIFIILITLTIGVCGGYFIGSINNNKTVTTIKATDDENFNKLIKVYNTMIKQYVDDVDGSTLVDGAIKGMLGTVDDAYTSYYDNEATTTFYKQLKGSFYGVGCAIASNGTNIYVVSVLDDSPALKAGVLANDVILKVNDTDTTSLTAAKVVSLIEDSTKDLTLTVKRNDETKTIAITKGIVTIKSVSSTTYEKNNKTIGYIKIDLFAANTDEQFEKALTALEKNNIDSLIIDVRDNAGGYLSSVSNILSTFISKDSVLYQIETKNGIIKKYDTTSESRSYKIVVLQNSESASGSEILAAAIKEIYGGTVIGTNSYGKSSVQQTLDLGDGTMIKYTTQKWLTALGNNVGGFGLTPTITVTQSDAYSTSATAENDTQLQKALSTLAE